MPGGSTNGSRHSERRSKGLRTPSWQPVVPDRSSAVNRSTFDRTTIKSLPKSVPFKLDLLLGRMRRYVDAKLTQAGECAIHGLLVFRPYDMQLDLQVANLGCVNSCRRARQELRNQLQGFLRVATRKFGF